MVTASSVSKVTSKFATEGGKAMSRVAKEENKKKRTAAQKARKLSAGNAASSARGSTGSGKAAQDGLDVVKASLRKFHDKMRGSPRRAVTL